VDSNLFQYLYRPDYDQFDTICFWEYFKEYEMRLISSLSSSQKENLGNDYEENDFLSSVKCIQVTNLPLWKS
jgi:hypothetical protein